MNLSLTAWTGVASIGWPDYPGWCKNKKNDERDFSVFRRTIVTLFG